MDNSPEEPELVTLRGVRFQILRDTRGVVETIIAQRVGAIAPVFNALAPSALIYDRAARDKVIAIFREEEGKHLAATLNVARTTIWGIRRGFGIAEKQLGASRTTLWRRQRQGKLTTYSGPPPADAPEEAYEEAA